jgi:DNA-binding response OmpR family regulator
MNIPDTATNITDHQHMDLGTDLAKRPHLSHNLFKKILIVDDEIKVTRAYKLLFLHEGFHVFMSTGAVQAKDILTREPIDVVVMDINMPDITGAELFENIRAFHKGTKVLVASVHSVEEQKERVRGADGYFDKTDSIEDLLNAVKSLLSKN